MTVISLYADSSIVDKHVKTAELLLDVLYCGGDGCVVIRVELDKTGRAFWVHVLYLLECSLAFRGVAGPNNDVVVG